MPISGRTFCRRLEKNGWILRRIKGSHHIYAKPGVSALLVVPVHGDRALKKGLLVRLAKIANIAAR
jgi:predicted RNA binding protein YcfA (HicA-like mRNA interferase family)